MPELSAMDELNKPISEEIDFYAEYFGVMDLPDEEIEERIAAEEQTRAEKDTELEGMMLTQEGTEFDSESGILTLKSKEGTNDIQVQFYSNFGTF